MLFPWVLAGGLLATALTAIGLFVGAGSWLSGTPSPRVGRWVAGGLLLAAWTIVFGGGALAVTAREQGWVGPKFWFSLETPAGYAGHGAIRWCPDEGDPPGDVVRLDDRGVATVRGPSPDTTDHWMFDVVDRAGARTHAYRQAEQLGSDGCQWMVVAVADEAWTVQGGQGDPVRYDAISREEGIPYSRAARRLPERLVVPDGYRGDVAVGYCWTAPPGGDTLTVDANGVARTGGPMPVVETDPDPFPVYEQSGRRLVGRQLRTEWGGASCNWVEVRVAEDTPSAQPATGRPVEQVVADAIARGVPYATVATER